MRMKHMMQLDAAYIATRNIKYGGICISQVMFSRSFDLNIQYKYSDRDL